MLRPHELARFDLGKGRLAAIAEARDWDQLDWHRGVLCRILADDKRDAFEWRSLGGVWRYDHKPSGVKQYLMSLRFSMIFGAGGDLVGIVECRQPDVVIELIDFRTHECWNGISGSVSANRCTEKRVEELEAAHPGHTFKLSMPTWDKTYFGE